MIAAIGLVLGVLVGLVFSPTVPPAVQPYLPIAVVAALDAVFGGLRALLDGIFDDRVFVVSFLWRGWPSSTACWCCPVSRPRPWRRCCGGRDGPVSWSST